jgi:glycine C-acetyltransferase/8-amino-7-oxononanoate synthase
MGLEFIEKELFELRQQDLFRDLRTIESTQGRVVSLHGRDFICFSSNNYLDLAADPRVIEAAVEASRDYGVGATASRLISGNMLLHNELEEAIAAFKRSERSIVFPTGYMANLGAISALVGPEDAIIADRLCHASIIDGAKLSGAKLMVFKHCDLDSLESALEHAQTYRRKLIVTDTLFSMDGDIAPLIDIVNICRKYDAMTMIDEAHATGVFGATGRGVAEHFGIEGEIDVVMGTLSKAVGCVGGYVCGSKHLIDYIRNKARSFIYTTAIPPAICAAAMKALEIIDTEPERRDRLWRNISFFRSSIDDTKHNLMDSSSQIIPVLLSDVGLTLETSRRLYKEGFLVSAIRPPTVPKGQARLRINLMSSHTEQDIVALLSVL